MSESEDKLHRLIHSLDKSEKGYVKKFAALHVKEDANGIRLFDIYNNVKIYSKEKIEKLVRKEKFANHLPKTKNYLFELILKALRNYYSEKKESYSMKTQIQNADILKDKGLYKEALSIIKRTKKTALENEIYFPLIEALYIERRIWPSYHVNPIQNDILFKLSQEEEKHYKYMDEAVAFFTDAAFKSFLYAHLMGKGDKQVVLDKYEQLVTSENYQRLLYLASKKIALLHQNVITYHHYIKVETELFNKEGEILLKYCLDKKQNTSFTREVIVGLIVNLGVAASRFYNKKLFTSCIKGLEEFKNEIGDPENHAYILAESCLSDLHFGSLLLLGEFEKGLQVCEQYIKKGKIIDDALNDNLMIFYINKSVSHFLLQQFPEAIKALNAIELYTEKHTHPYADSEFYLLKILSHLEMGNSEAAFYIAKSYKNLLEKESLNFYQRKAFVEVIVKNPLAEKKQIAKLTAEKIREEKIPLDMCWDQFLIDINTWCHCVVSNSSITQEYKKQYAQLYK
ncbi:MAG: hypothetical protein NT150_12070 [Bacteroidetes bacterium]|nr:hypothetical protein [Bacteroidota bacterium]